MTDAQTAHASARQLPPAKGRESIVPLVRADLYQRMEAGMKTYGTPLESHNGRDALRDAYEEALDLACYLKQAMIERDAMPKPAHHMSGFNMTLKAAMYDDAQPARLSGI